MKIALFESSDLFRKVIRSSLDGAMSIVWSEFREISEESEELINNECFDAIVTSKELSNGDYHDVAKSVHISKVNQETPIYLISSDESPEFLNSAFDASVTDVFSKQNLPQLVETFKKVLSFKTSVSGAHILLIEDDRRIAAFYEKSLTDQYFRVSVATCYDEAEKILNEMSVELVITDLHLDSGDHGQRIIRYIRRHENPSLNNLPLMVLSGSPLNSKQTRLYYLGMDEYLLKPVLPNQICLRAINLIKKYRLYKKVIDKAAEFKEAAQYDSLTRGYNRDGFFDVTKFIIAGCRRKGDPVGILYIDLDNFKTVNDEHGHQAGDSVLTLFSKILKNELREQDVMARWGGDEFVVLLYECNDEFLLSVAERVSKAVLAKKKELYGSGCSIGVTSGVPVDTDQLSVLIEQADQAMYISKNKNKGGVSVYR